MAANALYATTMNNQAQMQGKNLQKYLGNMYEHDMHNRKQREKEEREFEKQMEQRRHELEMKDERKTGQQK